LFEKQTIEQAEEPSGGEKSRTGRALNIQNDNAYKEN
jgi:hypothetical protein